MEFNRVVPIVALSLVPFLGAHATGCAAGPTVQSQSDDVTEMSNYEMNLERANTLWPDEVPIAGAADAWTALVKVGDQTIPSPTHLFGNVINIIPYADADGETDAAGAPFAFGDQEIAKVFRPGQLGIGLKMHRPERRIVDLNSADATQMKEDFKLQDTHIEVVVGVEQAEHGQAGAITVNNPQTYENGRFGTPTYSMILLRPEYPDYAGARASDYEANARLALLGFNAVTDFPDEYNGGDPLGPRNPDRVRTHVDQMVKAIAGDEEARDWFLQEQHMVYCAELAFLALSAGVIQPLNEATMVPRVGQAAWDAFAAEVATHNRGVDEFQQAGAISEENVSNFVRLNGNERVALVRLNLAPDDLVPLAQLSPDPAAHGQLLAYLPMTMSDIVEQFMRTHLPREILGEALAPVQGAVLAKMKPGLLETMGMSQLPQSDPRRVAVEQLFEQIVGVVGTTHGSYAEFRSAIEPYLQQARVITGPRDETGTGLFTPPSLFHVAAQGKHTGLLTMQYEGHGVHVVAVQRKGSADPPPTPVEDIDQHVSCTYAPDGRTGDSCGQQAPGGCWCDGHCTERGDCCGDYVGVCPVP